MKIVYFPEQIAINGRPVLTSFLEGCRRLGWTPVENSYDADMAVIWSQVWAGRMLLNQMVWQRYRQSQRSVIVLEVGSLFRGHTWKLGLDGINQDAHFVPSGTIPDRVKRLGIVMKDWQTTGSNILICTQRIDSEQWVGQPDLRSWIDTTITILRKYTDRKIIIRPHPRLGLINRWPGVDVIKPRSVPNTYDDYDFESALATTWAVINHNSSPGIVSIINGVPAFVSRSSLAADIANINLRSIETPSRRDRSRWIDRMAHTEWTVEELASGKPIQDLLLSVPSQRVIQPGQCEVSLPDVSESIITVDHSIG